MLRKGYLYQVAFLVFYQACFNFFTRHSIS